MAAAGASALTVEMALNGLGDIVRQIREGADQFDGLRASVGFANDEVGRLRAQLSSGATASAFGGLASQFRSIGIEAERLPEIAHEFRERLFRDPIAISAFGRSVLPARMGGPQDEVRELREAMDMLRSITRAEDRLYEARRLGLEATLQLIDADQEHTRAMFDEGARRGAMVDEELRQLRANNTANESRLKDLQAERDLDIERSRLNLKNWWQEHVLIPLSELNNRTNPNIQRFRDRAAAETPQDRQTTAIEQNTRALATLKDELANSGRRGNAAVPAALRGVTLEKALESGKLQTGAFIP